MNPADSVLLADLLAYWPEIARGLWQTIILSGAVTLTGLVGGLMVFYLLLSPSPATRAITNGYVSVMIGTPLIVFLFLMYYGLPAWGIRLSPFTIALIGFTCNVSAYNARYFLTAYKGLDPNERAYARAQGFTHLQVFRLITVPQAARLAVPALTNQAIQNIKDSSIVFLIQYVEFFAQMQEVVGRTFAFFPTYLLTALVYLLLVSIVVLGARWLERRLAIPGLATT